MDYFYKILLQIVMNNSYIVPTHNGVISCLVDHENDPGYHDTDTWLSQYCASQGHFHGQQDKKSHHQGWGQIINCIY